MALPALSVTDVAVPLRHFMIGQSWRVLVDDWLVSAELAVTSSSGGGIGRRQKTRNVLFAHSEGCATKKEVTHMITYVVDIRGRNVRGSDEFSEAMWLPLCSPDPSLLALPHPRAKASLFIAALLSSLRYHLPYSM